MMQFLASVDKQAEGQIPPAISLYSSEMQPGFMTYYFSVSK